MAGRGRPIGSGQLSVEKQQEVIRAILLRKQLTYRVLAKRLNASISAIKTYASRIQRRGLVELGSATVVPRETEIPHGKE